MNQFTSFIVLFLCCFFTDTFENPYNINGSAPYWLCEAQGFCIIFASDAAILWTISIGVYFFVTIALQQPKHALRLLPIFYVLAWGVSISTVLWLLLTDSLGALIFDGGCSTLL